MKGRDIIASFRGVDKTYDGKSHVVKRLDLDVYRGEFLTLLGPSGSGKTTCLMMLAGFEAPTGGEIWLDNVLINTVSPQKRDIGVVFQNYALFPHLTVEQNIQYPLTVRRIARDERAQRVHEALKMVRMEGLGKRYPAQLSGGQQQRVALARALVFTPRLVLMDEPLGALDKQLREKMQYELKSLHDALGITFIYVTHDQGEALTMSDRVAVFEAGRVQQLDTVEHLYEAPSSPFVASFIGDNNPLAGTVVGLDDRFCTLRLSDGSEMRGVKAGDLRVGAPATALIRPERLRLANGRRDGVANRVNGEIQRLSYFGDHVRLYFSLADQRELFVKVPLGTPTPGPLTPGSRLWLEFDAEHLRVFV
ncbi:ABC transporter ATP-binding protein (plasmid) [Burkholderia sp. FERM BP-3421]|uniref:ABC transporter ATP-binding protein n=1 Tax=Burkholderia sp. FERM BP-3421 TaxID=1494466 RepID=UPI002362CF21|nr:ABC transporter ATP-binding protein [Burkholderia sp. FERM BP-3421]WDD90236.1 ABC transporter ATP-binding protein [Burkholderia sp. FERM BP-3421]